MRDNGAADLTLYLWVQNLFDTQNTTDVWNFTGEPDDDGFLATLGGRQFIESAVPVSETLYMHRNRIPEYVGIPRLVRLGLQVNF